VGFRREEVPTKRVETEGEVRRLVRSLAVEGSGEVLSKRGETPKARLSLLEKIYRMDGLVFGLVNKYARDVVSGGYTITSEDEESRRIVENFCRDRKRGFGKFLRTVIRDCLIYGFAIYEIIPNRANTEVLKILRVDPKTIDYGREPNGSIKQDEYGYPTEFVQTTSRGKKITLPVSKVAFFTLYSLEEGRMGISPLEILYKPILFKLNMEEGVGESVWRIGFPPIILSVGDDKHPPSEELVTKLEGDLKNLTSKSAFIFPYWINMRAMELGKPERVETYLHYFSNIIRECLGFPRIETEEKGRDTTLIDYERTIRALQNELAEQIEEQIFEKISPVYNLKSIPRISFVEYSPTTRLSMARRLGILTRAGLLTRDIETENLIRSLEGLPQIPNTEEEREKRDKLARGHPSMRFFSKDEEGEENEE